MVMRFMAEVVAGAALGGLYVVAVRRLAPRATRLMYAVGLVIAAIIYVGFALIGGADPRWTALELAGLVPYTLLAWLGWRCSAWWLAAGWLAHVAWDVGGHLVGGTPAFVPAWYPAVCLGFDIYVAGAIALSVMATSGAEASSAKVAYGR
jgi:hypothetical protein